MSTTEFVVERLSMSIQQVHVCSLYCFIKKNKPIPLRPVLAAN